MITEPKLINVSETSDLIKLLAKVDKFPVLLKKDGKLYRLSKERKINGKKQKAPVSEIPNIYLRNAIKQSEKNYQKGNVSPRFSDSKEAIRYLEEQGI